MSARASSRYSSTYACAIAPASIKPCIVHVETRGIGERLSAVHGIRLPSPEIDIPAQRGAGLTHPEAVPRERRRDQVILRGALVQRARIELGVRQQHRLFRLRLRQRFRHSRLRLRQSRTVFHSCPYQPVELRILE